MLTTIDWLVNVLVPTFFQKLDGWMLTDGVSVLGVCAAAFIVLFVYRRFV